MHKAAAYDSACASQRVCAHAPEQPSPEGQPRERQSPAAADAPVAIVKLTLCGYAVISFCGVKPLDEWPVMAK